MLGLGTYLLIELGRASDYAAAIYQKDLRNASTIAEIDSLLMRADLTVLRMFAIGDPESIAQWKKDNEQRFAAVEKSLDSLGANAGVTQSAAITNLRNAFHSLQAGMRHQVERIEAGDIEGGTEVNRVEVKAQSDNRSLGRVHGPSIVRARPAHAGRLLLFQGPDEQHVGAVARAIPCVIRETLVLEFAKKLDQVGAPSCFCSNKVDFVGRAILVVRLHVHGQVRLAPNPLQDFEHANAGQQDDSRLRTRLLYCGYQFLKP